MNLRHPGSVAVLVLASVCFAATASNVFAVLAPSSTSPPPLVVRDVYDAPPATTTSASSTRNNRTHDERSSSARSRSGAFHVIPKLAAKEAPRLLGPGTNFGKHVRPEKLAERGWTERLVRSTIDGPVRTVPTRDYRRIPGSADRMDDPATAYYGRRGGYVVRNNRTGDIVQVSDRLDPYWKAPWDR